MSNNRLFAKSLLIIAALTAAGAQGWGEGGPTGEELLIKPLAGEVDFFPAVVQFSPLPAGPGWQGEKEPVSKEVWRQTVDNLLEHGFRGIESVRGDLPKAENGDPAIYPKNPAAYVEDYARSRGMVITHHTGGLEGFGREAPPAPSVYSPEYGKAVRERVEAALGPLKDIPRLYNVFTYQDEPFHWGPRSFGFSEDVKAEFRKRYGYDLPPDLDSIRNEPKKWLDVINFRSDNFPDGWRQVYKAIKEVNPNFIVTLTHDSHNTFGAGYSSHAELAIDDVYHWGGDFADMFVFDIYPYMMFDFRFGQCSQLPQPRISQTHYSFAQMRNLTRAYNKKLGFWVGTYNPAWFQFYLGPELAGRYWSEREMSATAVAAGADYLLTGYNIPVDAKHWDSFGEGLRLIQEAGGRLLRAPKVKAKACMLFPRTHYIQMQEEYFNVGLSFELFMRAFGELDILHEEQVVDDRLDGYQVLVLFDVKVLPEQVAQRIAAFVEKGGVVIADCVPQMNEYKEPMATMADLFGVRDAETGRIVRSGHWVPYKNTHPAMWANRPANPPDETVYKTDRLVGEVLGQALEVELVSPRGCVVAGGEVLAKTQAGQPGVVQHKVGGGQAFLLGFCLQDTWFKTWQDPNPAAREQLRGLLRAMTEAAGIRSHVYSSNPDIEASLRANDREGFLFVINHEAASDATTVRVGDLPIEIGQIVDLATGQPVSVRDIGGHAEMEVVAGIGQTRLFHVQAKEKPLANLPENLRLTLENTRSLPFPRGNRLGLYLWPIMGTLGGLNDADAAEALRQLDSRGIAMCVNWDYGDKEKTLAEGLRIGAMQKKLGLRVNVNANACLYSFFNGEDKTFHVGQDGKPFYDDSFGGQKMGCPFALDFRYPAIKEQVEYFLRGYKAAGIGVDFIFADWEIDGPIEWNDAWANSKKCRRCREHIPNIEDFREFQKELRTLRSHMQKMVFADPVKAYFPGALVGNYAVYPHNGYRYWYDYFEKPAAEGIPVLEDQRARYREWFAEFEPTGYTFAMPPVYPWSPIYTWYDFENGDYRWFYNMLLVASNAGEHTPGRIPLIPFVHGTVIEIREKPEPPVPPFSREKYQELLWHLLLRGHDTFFLWCTNPEFGQEVKPLHEVYAAALEYKDFLDYGQPVSFAVPKTMGPVVSGMKLGSKILVRRTDFDDKTEPVQIQLDNQMLEIPSAPGKCQILTIPRK